MVIDSCTFSQLLQKSARFTSDHGPCIRQIEGLLSNLEESIISVDDSMSSPSSITPCHSAEKERQIRIVQQISEAFQHFKSSAQACNFESPDYTSGSFQRKVRAKYDVCCPEIKQIHLRLDTLIIYVCFVRTMCCVRMTK